MRRRFSIKMLSRLFGVRNFMNKMCPSPFRPVQMLGVALTVVTKEGKITEGPNTAKIDNNLIIKWEERNQQKSSLPTPYLNYRKKFRERRAGKRFEKINKWRQATSREKDAIRCSNQWNFRMELLEKLITPVACHFICERRPRTISKSLAYSFQMRVASVIDTFCEAVPTCGFLTPSYNLQLWTRYTRRPCNAEWDFIHRKSQERGLRFMKFTKFDISTWLFLLAEK